MPGSFLFFANTEEDIDQFIREYVLGAIDRVDSLDVCEGISFDRDERVNPEGASVVLMVASDFDAFVEHERDHWREYHEAGLIEDCETQRASEEGLEKRFVSVAPS